MKRLVLNPDYFPAKLPLVPTCLWWLMLDKLHAPQWLWAVTGTLLFILWFVAIVALTGQRFVSIRELLEKDSQ